MGFKGKIAWITGASSGIGEAIAYELDRMGAKVILSSRREDELFRVKQNCKHQENIKILPLDLFQSNTLEIKTLEAINIFGDIDFVFHNGGISQRSVASETSIEVDRRIMEINFFSYVAITKAVLPHFKSKKSGAFIITSSVLGQVPVPFRTAYAASKHALHGFFESLREEVYQDNINVLMVCPGYIKTNVSINALTESGAPLNIMQEGQEKGMLPAVCARKIILALESGKKEIYIGGKEIITIFLKRISPSLFRKIIRKVKT
jgi:dehydrogenase/reductase SDR family member 7B